MAKRRHTRHLSVRATHRADGRLALEVGGVVQSIALPADGADHPALDPSALFPGGYWEAMLPHGCPARALLLGLGGGTVARLLARRCPGVAMVGIERNAAVLQTARAALALDDVPGLTAVLADAFVWVPAAVDAEPASYDYICLDLFEGGRLTLGALATPFLRQVAALLAPGGVLAVNLMVTGRTPDQVHRLERVYRPLLATRVRGNLVLHLRPLTADERAAPTETAPDA